MRQLPTFGLGCVTTRPKPTPASDDGLDRDGIIEVATAIDLLNQIAGPPQEIRYGTWWSANARLTSPGWNVETQSVRLFTRGDQELYKPWEKTCLTTGGVVATFGVQESPY